MQRHTNRHLIPQRSHSIHNSLLQKNSNSLITTNTQKELNSTSILYQGLYKQRSRCNNSSVDITKSKLFTEEPRNNIPKPYNKQTNGRMLLNSSLTENLTLKSEFDSLLSGKESVELPSEEPKDTTVNTIEESNKELNILKPIQHTQKQKVIEIEVVETSADKTPLTHNRMNRAESFVTNDLKSNCKPKKSVSIVIEESIKQDSLESEELVINNTSTHNPLEKQNLAIKITPFEIESTKENNETDLKNSFNFYLEENTYRKNRIQANSNRIIKRDNLNNKEEQSNPIEEINEMESPVLRVKAKRSKHFSKHAKFLTKNKEHSVSTKNYHSNYKEGPTQFKEFTEEEYENMMDRQYKTNKRRNNETKSGLSVLNTNEASPQTKKDIESLLNICLSIKSREETAQSFHSIKSIRSSRKHLAKSSSVKRDKVIEQYLKKVMINEIHNIDTPSFGGNNRQTFDFF